MNVTITTERPNTKPLREYETRIIYVGFKYRYDQHTKMLSSIERCAYGQMVYVEIPAQHDVFSRGYASEIVRVSVYSESPRIWVEEISLDHCFCFTEVAH